jgi:hypothetical protein
LRRRVICLNRKFGPTVDLHPLTLFVVKSVDEEGERFICSKAVGIYLKLLRFICANGGAFRSNARSVGCVTWRLSGCLVGLRADDFEGSEGCDMSADGSGTFSHAAKRLLQWGAQRDAAKALHDAGRSTADRRAKGAFRSPRSPL